VPGLQAVAAFGAHTMTTTALGHDEATVTTIPAHVPILLAAAADDVVINHSRTRYTSADGKHDPVGRTFDEAIDRHRGDSWHVELTDANHFTICHPVDQTSGRSFLEPDLRADDMDTRALLASLFVSFFNDVFDPASTTAVATVAQGPGIARWSQR